MVVYFKIGFFSFPVDRWLDSTEGDEKTALDLEPGVKPDNPTKGFL